MRFIDVHCHINGEDYGDVEQLMKTIKSAEVQKIITVGFDLPSTEYGRRLAERYEGVYFTAGFHPTELKKYREGDLDRIADAARHEKCVAIGEIGLDYHYPDTDKPLQAEIFRRQIYLAEALGLPVQIHSRDCAEDMVQTLKEYAPHLKYGAMLHCYSHSTETAVELEKLGISFSFGGTSTWSSSKKAKRTIAALPLEKLMTETDSPYLAPRSLYGKFPNTPASIPEIAENMAEIKGIALEELAESVWTNAHALFKKLNN